MARLCLEDAVPVWVHAATCDFSKLDKVQNHATKTMTRLTPVKLTEFETGLL